MSNARVAAVLRWEGWQWWTWIAYAAAAWCFGYAILGVLWAFGAAGFPFGRNDPSAEITLFADVEAGVGGTTIAVLGMAGGVGAIVLARASLPRVFRLPLSSFAWALAALLLLAIPDYRPLLAVAYAPIVLVGAPFDWPPDVGLSDVFPWPVVNQLVCMVGGAALAGTAIVAGRRARGACPRCGRSASGAGWTSRASAERWGRWATRIAVAIPILYAATRYAWALGIPLGVSESFLREGKATGLWWAGAALATLAVGGALLTTGLVRPWGTSFPQWTPFVGRRPVPPTLAIVPASVVALLVTSAGVMFARLVVAGTLSDAFTFAEEIGWIALAPELLWPIWGVALSAATLAYHLGRRGPCGLCGRS